MVGALCVRAHAQHPIALRERVRGVAIVSSNQWQCNSTNKYVTDCALARAADGVLLLARTRVILDLYSVHPKYVTHTHEQKVSLGVHV
jgi:hypothetical protein